MGDAGHAPSSIWVWMDLDECVPDAALRRTAGLVPRSPAAGDQVEREKWRQAFSAARSVLVVALPYWHEMPPECGDRDQTHGLLARCAWGEDYHHVTRGEIDDLLHRLDCNHSAVVWTQVDSGPLDERRLARQVGLGSPLANGCLAIDAYGSWLFLGVVLLKNEAPSGPTGYRDHEAGGPECSRCGLCVEACPTGALTAPYKLNPYRCLSYVTQSRGFLPRALRRPLGNRLYGCDTCQEVCPLNQQVAEGHPAFARLSHLRAPSLRSVTELSEEAFNSTFGLTAAGWRGRRTLQRNALIAWGNEGRFEEAELIRPYLFDPRPVIRGHAAWALGRLLERHGKSPKWAHTLLQDLHNNDTEGRVRWEAAAALSRLD